MEEPGADEANLRRRIGAGSQRRRALDEKARHHLRWVQRNLSRATCRKNARRLGKLVEKQFKDTIGSWAAVLVTRFRQSNFQAEQMIGAKTRVDSEQLLKTPDNQRAEKQHHNSDGDLSGHQRASAQAMPAGARANSWAKSLRQTRRSLEHRQQSKENRGQCAGSQREQQHRNAEPDGLNHGQIDAGRMGKSETQ